MGSLNYGVLAIWVILWLFGAILVVGVPAINYLVAVKEKRESSLSVPEAIFLSIGITALFISSISLVNFFRYCDFARGVCVFP